MTCQACRERGKTWSGDDPKCAFDGDFRDNWNCATLNQLRDAIIDANHWKVPTVGLMWHEDQWYATIALDEPDTVNALFVTWYKSRGKTEDALAFYDDTEAWHPTEAECVEATAEIRDKVTAIARRQRAFEEKYGER